MTAAIARAKALYPPPWIVGWWEREGRWGVEASKRIGYARFERVVTAEGEAAR